VQVRGPDGQDGALTETPERRQVAESRQPVASERIASRPAVALERLRSRIGPALFRREAVAGLTHLLILIAAFFGLLRANRFQWFFGDEWDFLAQRGLRHAYYGLFVPHNEHWTTVPILIYRGLYSVFGLHSYTPYIIVVILTHLLVVHLLWQLMRRCGVEPVVASALSAIYAFLGAGSENLLSAFQVTFIGSVAAGLVHVLLVRKRGPFGSRDVFGWLAAVIGLMCSSIGVTMVAVAGLVALFRRGAKLALLTVGVPAAVYLGWLAVAGKEGLGGHETNFDRLLQLPTYLWSGLTTTFERGTGLPGSGPVLVLGLGTWLFLRTHLRKTNASAAVAMALGAVLLYVVVGIGRAALGVDQARATRYVYISLALLLPAIGLLLTQAVGRLPSRRVVALGVLGLVFVQNLSPLRETARNESTKELSIKRQILAAVELQSSGALLVSASPDPLFSPNLTMPQLQQMKAQEKLPAGTNIGEVDRLTASTYLQVAMTDSPLIGAGGAGPPAVVATARTTVAPRGKDCQVFTTYEPSAQVAISHRAPASFQVRASGGGQLGVSLRDGDEGAPTGPVRSFTLPADAARWLNVSRAPAWLFLTLPEGEVELCSGRDGRRPIP